MGFKEDWDKREKQNRPRALWNPLNWKTVLIGAGVMMGIMALGLLFMGLPIPYQGHI